MPILTEGAIAAEQISDENRSSSGFFRPDQVVIKDGETVALRFLTEHTKILTFDVHGFVATKPKPDKWPGTKFPKAMWAVCQNDRAFRLRDEAGNLTPDFEDGYGDCWLHAHLAGQLDKFNNPAERPQSNVYGLAVARKLVTDPKSGNVVGLSDETIEYKAADGKVYTLPKIVLVCQRYANFWHPLKATAFLPPHTILNRDYIVSRKDKDYTFSPSDPTPDLQPGTPAWARYDQALELTGFTLAGYMLEHATRDHYARFFIEGEDPSDGYGRGGSDADGAEDDSQAGPDVTTAGSAGIDPDAMARFTEQLASRGKK